MDQVNITPIHELLAQAVSRRGYKTATYYEGDSLSYRRLSRHISSVAAFIDKNSLSGDRVGILIPNCPQFIIAYLAILVSGRIAVPINYITIKDKLDSKRDVNTIMPTEKIAHQISDSKPSIIFVADFLFPILAKIGFDWKTTIVTVNLVDYIPLLKRPIANHIMARDGRKVSISVIHDNFTDIAKSGERFNETVSRPDNLALIQYTGGTTGVPKGAGLTYRNLLSNIWQMGEIIDPYIHRGSEVMLAALPFFHVYGLNICILTGLLKLDSPLVIISRFDPKVIVNMISKYKVTIFPGLNRMFPAILALKNRHDLSRELESLRLCVCGAGSIVESVVTDFQKITNVKILRAYGLSEASPGVSVCLPGSKQPDDTRGGLIGTPLPETGIRIVDKETGIELADGEVGIISIAGPQVMQGYWNRPDETKEVIDVVDGVRWLNTGDLGYLREGQLYFVGRKKHMAAINSENIYFCDIERYASAIDGLYGIAMIAVPDDKSGEAIAAVVSFEEGYQITVDFIRHRLLEISGNRYYVPKEILLLNPSEFDTLKNQLGKVDEEILAKLVSKRLRIELP